MLLLSVSLSWLFWTKTFPRALLKGLGWQCYLCLISPDLQMRPIERWDFHLKIQRRVSLGDLVNSVLFFCVFFPLLHLLGLDYDIWISHGWPCIYTHQCCTSLASWLKGQERNSFDGLMSYFKEYILFFIPFRMKFSVQAPLTEILCIW